MIRIRPAIWFVFLLAGCNVGALPPPAQYGTLTGTVIDNSGTPVPGATVTIDTSFVTTTDATGSFRQSGLPNGDVDYVAAASGYGPMATGGSTQIPPGGTIAVTIVLPKSR